MLQYETSLESSFLSTEATDNTQISLWKDNNPQSITKNNSTQSTLGSKPKFYENVFAGIPAVRFDGTDDYFSFDGTFLSKSNYTIFVVEQRRSAIDFNLLIGGTATGPSNTLLHLGYRYNTTMTQAHYSNDLNYTLIPAYSQPTPRFHTFQFSKISGKSYWLNGGVNADKTEPTQTSALNSYAGAQIAKYNYNNNIFSNTYYNGDIAEIVIFVRDLKNEERQAIEAYLSKKYNIAITG